MEGSSYLALFLILAFLMVIGLILIIRKKSKNKTYSKVGGVLLFIIPIIILFWNPISKLFMFKPNESDLIGKYAIIKADNNIDENDFQNYILELKVDQTFSLTPTPGIGLCQTGNYSLDYSFEYNELAFQCASAWTPKCIKRKFRGFEIEFFLDFESGESICFEKIE